MTNPAVTAVQAAAELGVTPAAVRAWVRAGAPHVRLKRPLLVDVKALRRWRAGQHADVPDQLGVALLDVLRREAVDGRPAHRMLGVSDRAAAGLLLFSFSRLHVALMGRDSTPPLPDSIKTLRAMAGLPADPA